MAYIQLTTRCNMLCSHCGSNCTAKGSDMSMSTFKKAIDFFSEAYNTIGGGEPTVHPKFRDMLGYAILYGPSFDDEYNKPFLVTNGKITETALWLAKLSQRGIIDVQLSQDPFHEPIDPKVVKTFKELGVEKIRDTSEDIVNTGRAKKNQISSEEDGCFCSDLIISPTGNIKLCGCENSPSIGNINKLSSEQLSTIMDILGENDFHRSGCWNDELKCNGKDFMMDMLKEIRQISRNSTIKAQETNIEKKNYFKNIPEQENIGILAPALG